MYDTVLIPTDGSDPANRAAEHGFELAEQHDATVHLLFVVELPNQGLGSAYGGIEGGFPIHDKEVLPALEEQAESLTDDLAERADAFDLDARTAVRSGMAPEELLQYSDDHSADLIVMGTHGRRGVERVLLGSVTERVIRTADVPVLVVRTDD